MKQRLRFACLAAMLGLLGVTFPAQAAPFAYITNNIGIVEIVDIATNTIVAKVPVSGGNVRGVTTSPDGALVYMASVSGNRIHVFDTATNAVVATVPVGHGPNGIALAAGGAFAYVANTFDNTVSVIDTATNTVVDTVAVGAGPYGVAASPGGTGVYVTNGNANSVSVIDTATRTVVATVDVGMPPRHIAISPDGAFAYVGGAGGSGHVAVIATATNAVTATVPVGQGTTGIAVTPDGALVYVADSFSDSVSVVDAATNTVVTSVLVGNFPNGISVTPDGAFVYVANLAGKTLSILDTATNVVVGTVPLEFEPFVFGQFISPGPNRAPTPTNDTYIAQQNTPLTVAAPGVLVNDADPDGDALEAFRVSGPTHGTLQLSPTGGFTYTPDAGYTGPDSFIYQAADGRASTNATASITVSAPTCGIAVQPVTIAQPYVALPYLQTFSASPSQKYTFSVSGSLPPGLYFLASAQGGALLGIPTTPGTYTFTITAQKKDSGCRNSRTYTVTVPKTVVPLLTCVQKVGNNTYRGTFGFASSMDAPVSIPIGADNAFTPGAQNRGQVTVFAPGTVVNAFSVTFTASGNGSDLAIWFLRGPDGQRRPITVTRATFGCQ